MHYLCQANKNNKIGDWHGYLDNSKQGNHRPQPLRYFAFQASAPVTYGVDTLNYNLKKSLSSNIPTMNLGEFPLPVCAPLKPRHNPIDYPGTANISCAHRLREPNSNCRYMKQFYDLRKSTEIDPNDEQDARELASLNRRFDFEKRTDRRVIAESIRRRVEQGMLYPFKLQFLSSLVILGDSLQQLLLYD